MSRIFIFGAHSRAQTLAVYLRALEPDTEIVAYLTDDEEENPSEIGGVPVIRPNAVPSGQRVGPVYLAIRGVNHGPVEERLRALGYGEIIPITPAFDSGIRIRFLRKLYADADRPFVLIDDLAAEGMAELPPVRIYEVCSAYDKPLQKDHYERLPEESRIQVGAALTDIRLPDCAFYDDEGDNISAYNRQLCEETALYWIWKHAREDFIGLVHYRRHFILPEDYLRRMLSGGVDVILPIPLYVMPNVTDNYRFRHIPGDWDKLLEILSAFDPDEGRYAAERFRQPLYFPLNIFVMRREVLQDYCSWLFPRLFEVMKRIGQREDVYQNRYPAFMAERLLTLYFEMHRDKYHIVYADKGFLQ